MTSMTCPRCDAQPLAGVSMGGAPASSCRGCGGHAVHRAALRTAADPAGVGRLWDALVARASPGALRCPRCAQPMGAVQHQGVEIDACPPCGLIWFDPKERRASTRAAPAVDTRAAEASRQFAAAEAEERRRALEDARAGRVPSRTDPVDVVEGILRVLEGLFTLP